MPPRLPSTLALVAAIVLALAGLAAAPFVMRPAPTGVSAQTGYVVTRTITAGTQNTSLGEGEADQRFTWNYSGRFEDPRYTTFTTSDDGSGTWAGKHLWANCIMNAGRCWSNTDYGPDVPANMPPYAGVEYLYYAFNLPGDASNVQLSSSSIGGDDRLVLLVNGRIIGGYTSRVSGPTPGIIEASDGSTMPITYVNPSQTPILVDDPAIFIRGGQNVLTFWINNTGSTNFSARARPHSAGDISRFAITAELSYVREDGPPTATALPTSTPAPTRTPTAMATPQPTATALPPGEDASCVCDEVAGRVPPAVVNAALANPQRVYGWRKKLNPNRPEGPDNPLRECLSIRNRGVAYHPAYNPLIFQVGCE